MADIIIETERLILRTQAAADFDIYMQHINTPAVRRYLGGVEEAHEAEAAFARSAANQAREGFSFWFAALKETGTLIGICGLKRIDADAAPAEIKGDFEIGWILREDCWGKGYASEAAAASLNHAFARLSAPHVTALTSESNAASWRMMEKLGMERRRDLEFDDSAFPPEDNPTIVYRIDRKH
ncbi:MAG: GNAT family N-acetyltransferase [Sphingorhabdus sp.]